MRGQRKHSGGSSRSPETDWSAVFGVSFSVWSLITVIAGVVSAAILASNSDDKKELPYNDLRDTVPYSGIGAGVLGATLMLGSLLWCCCCRGGTAQERFERTNPCRKSFAVALVASGAFAGAWYGLAHQDRESLIPDLPKFVFALLGLTAVGTLGLVLAGWLLINTCCICCRDKCLEPFRKRPPLGRPNGDAANNGRRSRQGEPDAAARRAARDGLGRGKEDAFGAAGLREVLVDRPRVPDERDDQIEGAGEEGYKPPAAQ